MRQVFLLLLLVNLLIWGWQRWIVGPPAADPYALADAEIPTLVLLEPQPGAAASPPLASPGPAQRCTRLGPFATRDLSDEAAQALRRRGMQVAGLEEASQVWMGYWVQVTGIRGTAETALAELAAAGLEDAYLVGGGEEQRLSLGVFRSRQGARRIADQAREAGFEPLVEDRFTEGREFWLEVAHDEDSSPELGRLVAGGPDILRVEPVPCASAADSPGPADSLE